MWDYPTMEPMTLDDYLFKNGLTMKEFCLTIGYVDRYISGIKNGRYRLTRRVNQRIFQVTQGEVNLEEELARTKADPISNDSEGIKNALSALKKKEEEKVKAKPDSLKFAWIDILESSKPFKMR